MKPKHFIISALAAISLLTGCLSEQDLVPAQTGGIPINLNGTIDQIATKVNAGGFEDKDAIALYAVNYENSNQTPGTLKEEGNQADAVKYIFNEASWKWNPVRPVYYKDVNTNVDLYAFYPYAKPASVSEYNFEVQKDQSTEETESKLAGYEASDFLWAKAENVSPSENSVQMTLNHKMAGVHVILQEGTGFSGDFNVIEKKVLVTNTTRKAAINLTDGSVTPIGEAQTSGIVMAPQTDGSFRAIVVPQNIGAGKQLLSITIEGVAYSFSVNNAVSYISGKLNSYTITINRKQPSGEYELKLANSQIVDWTEDTNVHGDVARQYYCVNMTEPGTLGELIVADGKNPKKIKNLKVSGVISDEDFYFMRDEMTILEAVNLKECKVVDVEIKNGNLKVGESWVSRDPLKGHKDEYGNSPVFAQREPGVYNDIIPDAAFAGKESLYFFAFPENITEIGYSAFRNTSLSGSLTIPDNTKTIWSQAFENCNISSIILPPGLEILGASAFNECTSLTGVLALPETLMYIGANAFRHCYFNGNLILPNNLEYIGSSAFYSSGTYSGGLVIPDKIHTLYSNTFSAYQRSFTGTLNLNNVQQIEGSCFWCCDFSGELIIPEGNTIIGNSTFYDNNFTSVVLPSTIKSIESEAFKNNARLMTINFPEGLISIGESAFIGNRQLTSIVLPKTLQSIQANAFSGCSGIYSIICHSNEPPTVISGAFDGVAKDNFTVQVPGNAVNRYATDPVWGQFRRISAYYDFSISRNQARALNAETSKKYILRAPSGHNWSVQNKPDWITVTPSSGTGKTEVTVTFAKMSASEAANISVTMTDPIYAYQTKTKNLKGRKGEIVFSLEGKDYNTSMTVEQFDYQYGDGSVITLNEATKGNGVDIVLLGDCYDAADIAAGNYIADIEEAFGHYFDIEPYKTYKDYFNVYAVVGVSDDSGMGTLNTIKDAKFGSTFGEKNLVQPNMNMCFEYACKAPIDNNLAETLIILVENTSEYGGICYMYGDGTAVACCPKSADAYPYDFRGIVQHEAGGHGFGKLADEYIYHNAFISTCTCSDGCGHVDSFLAGKAKGWYANLELTGDMNNVGWSHLIFHPKYSNVVDIYEGGYFHTRGVYRSEPTSCMNNNIPYFSAISRQTMVERIMKYAGQTFNLDTFIENDVTTAAPTTKGLDITVPLYNNGKQHAPVYMGEKPDFIK